MEKYLRKSSLEICFFFLFVCNCLLAMLSIAAASLLLSSLAIVLSVFQVFLLRYFSGKKDHARTLSFSGIARELMRPFRLTKGLLGEGQMLTYKDKLLIRKRARNISAASFRIADCGNGKGAGLPERVTKVKIGTKECFRPYFLSILNSVASEPLSSDELYITSRAASLGGFALSTGLSGLQPGHVRGGGDLIWQYAIPFPVMQNFEHSEEAVFFRRNSLRPYVKMIEINIAGTEKYQYGLWVDEYNEVSFEKKYGCWGNNLGDLSQILNCLSTLRILSDRKPVGLRLLLRTEEDVAQLCKAISSTMIIPDFITIDQSSGYFILNQIRKQLDRHQVSTILLYSGKIVSELDLFKAVSLGASSCISTVPLIRIISSNFFCSAKSELNAVRLANYHRNTTSGIIDTHTHIDKIS